MGHGVLWLTRASPNVTNKAINPINVVLQNGKTVQGNTTTTPIAEATVRRRSSSKTFIFFSFLDSYIYRIVNVQQLSR